MTFIRWHRPPACADPKGDTSVRALGPTAACALLLLGTWAPAQNGGIEGLPDLSQTWAEINGEVYGAKPDRVGPIGGGTGYRRIVTHGDVRVSTIDELREALGKAQAGQVIFIPGDAELDCTGLIFAEDLHLDIPGGVTVASDRGHEGSPGALIYTDAFLKWSLIQTLGPNVRLSGLRIRGPDPKPRLDHHRRSFDPARGDDRVQHEYYYRYPVCQGVYTAFSGLEVDNCELSGWNHAAIDLADGRDHHIHHNYIHHNQYNGLGYGICHGSGAESVSLIEYNLFDYNRHSIAGTGKPGNAYEACNNVEVFHSLSHQFDMHGGVDRGDGTNIAGDWMKIHHNTFRNPDICAIAIRGVPQEQADIHHNWFSHAEPGEAVIRPWPTGGETRMEMHDNAYGQENPVVRDAGQ